MKEHFLSRTLIFASLILNGTTSFAKADTLVASSGKERVQLVELFSSESCSSCPPADAWVSTLQGRSGLWKTFIPIVFHVDYWNHLGWKDGFSSDEMTKRQVAISQTWSEPSVYTPGMIVDGREWRDWRSNPNSFPSSPNQKIELSIFKSDDGSFRVKASGLSSGKKYIVHVAKLGMGLSTDVQAGENSGRKLKHNFLVLDWTGNAVSQSMPEANFSFKNKESKTKPSRFAVAAWIEEEGRPIPLQSVGGYL